MVVLYSSGSSSSYGGHDDGVGCGGYGNESSCYSHCIRVFIMRDVDLWMHQFGE